MKSIVCLMSAMVVGVAVGAMHGCADRDQTKAPAFNTPVVAPEFKWEYWAPGGGGEIQSIYLEPNVKDRFYVMSDMEGLYRSDDGGETYRLLSADLPQINVFGLTSDPQKPDKLFLGTHRMALVSEDAGESWRAIEDTLTYPIQLIQVNPQDSNHVIMALSAPDIVDLNDMPQHVPEYLHSDTHPGLVFVSRDGGKTFTKYLYDAAQKKAMNAWQLAFDSVNQRVYIATERGLYASTDGGETWNSVTAPDGFSAALGFQVSPDGKTAFAIFARDMHVSSVFAADAEAVAAGSPRWNRVDQLYAGPDGDPALAQQRLAQPGETRTEYDGEAYTNPGQRYARLKVDPRSGQAEFGLAGKVRLLMGKTMKHHNSSLFYSEFSVADGVPQRGNWQRIYYEGGQKGWQTSQGSDNYVQVDSFDFVPVSWQRDHAIILENGHGVSRMDLHAEGFPKSGGETVLYQTAVREGNGAEGHVTWRNRGFVNTYNGDFATSENYFVAALSDQGLHESWDNGRSWIRDLRPSPRITASKSVEILKTEPPVVVLGTGYGYGAGDIPMGLWAKRLVQHSPADKWQHLAGGIAEWTGPESESANGLPSVPHHARVPMNEEAWDYRIWAMAADSQVPERLFVGFKGKGIYVSDNVPALLNGEGDGFRKLDLGPVELPKTSLVAHPQKANALYYPTGNSLFLYSNGEKREVHRFPGLVEDVNAWVDGESLRLAVAAVNPSDASHNVYVSLDGGERWHTVLDRQRLREAGVPKFFETPAYPREDPLMPFMGGLAGYKNWLIVPVGSIRNNLGIFAIHLGAGADQAPVFNVTGEGVNRHGYTRVNEGEVRWVNGEPWLVHSTRGAGVVAASLEALP
ncbi:hypothetical protein [Microbulbifer sp. Q7]|uniref:WD40/YVTN/BNR-like repeat-containing protein n=1 Tax=Microbulbifer sp. Q7 TaxID=1785091 RepID=UPI000A5594C9|nr:hypothetical protein [Microbulbifer sp. Q7]